MKYFNWIVGIAFSGMILLVLRDTLNTIEDWRNERDEMDRLTKQKLHLEIEYLKSLTPQPETK